MYINCWHLNHCESAAMWKLYLKSDEGIAVRTTFDRLRSCFDRRDAEREVRIGRVTYLDYETGVINTGNIFSPFLCKRLSFSHEQEVRAVFVKHPSGPEEMTAWPCGLGAAVDLDTLIEEIFVAPPAPHWIHELINAVAMRYGLRAPVRHSRLSEDPIY